MVRSLTLSAIILALIGTSAIVAQPPRGGGGTPPEPPAEAMSACGSLSEGAMCSFRAPQGAMISGQCHAPTGRALACIPEGGPPAMDQGGPPGGSSGGSSGRSRQGQGGGNGPPQGQGGGNGPPQGQGGANGKQRPNSSGSQQQGPGNGPPRSDQGPLIAATAAHTDSIFCALGGSGENRSAGYSFEARWSCAGGERSLSANGIPNHAIGRFPNAGNPNSIAPQPVRFSTTLNPVARSGAGAWVKIPGFALNGVRFDPGTAQSCDSACADHGQGHTNPWRIEALGQQFFAFGVDDSNAHVQPGGAYHYHGIPLAMLSADARAGRAMALVGWAVDGFPIYARWGHADPRAIASPLRQMRSSYRLKARPDAGRPPVNFAPMGTFTQDYEYVAGLGDLDECNGRTDVTPEFPRGIYHYYATDSFPFVQRCVKGTPTFVADDRPPPPPFGGLFGGPR